MSERYTIRDDSITRHECDTLEQAAEFAGNYFADCWMNVWRDDTPAKLFIRHIWRKAVLDNPPPEGETLYCKSGNHRLEVKRLKEVRDQ